MIAHGTVPNGQSDHLIDSCTDAFGNIRVGKVRDVFKNAEAGTFSEDFKFNFVEDSHARWVREDEYLILQGELNAGKIHDRRCVMVKCSKRGNDVNQRRCQSRFDPMLKLEDGMGKNKRRGMKFRTSQLFVTLTYDQMNLTKEQSWVGCSKELNRFFAGLRRKFGKISYFRVSEAHKNGYWHSHVIINFKDYSFDAFRYQSKKTGCWQVRINPKGILQKYWHGGYVDAQGVDDHQAKIRYLTKYLIKGLGRNASDEQAKGLAYGWFYGKRMYGISGGYIDLTTLCITQKHDYVICALDGKIVGWTWRFICVCPGWFAGLDGKQSKMKLSDPPPQCLALKNLKIDIKNGVATDYRFQVRELINGMEKTIGDGCREDEDWFF